MVADKRDTGQQTTAGRAQSTAAGLGPEPARRRQSLHAEQSVWRSRQRSSTLSPARLHRRPWARADVVRGAGKSSGPEPDDRPPHARHASTSSSPAAAG